MARIGLIDVDRTRFPNIALGKIAAWHKAHGDSVEWADPMFGEYDRVYASKVFTFSPDFTEQYNCEVIRGGTGYDIHSELPAEIDCMQPDYSIYPNVDNKTAYGFLTRGCIRKCPWCVVPDKEGRIRPYMDVEQIAIDGRKRLILMDNNLLAAGDYAKEQFVKIIDHGYRIDLNQANDARLVDDDFADLMARAKWIDYIRFGCDTPGQIAECERAIALLRKHGFAGRFFLYCILNGDFAESFERIDYWHRKADWRIHPYAQPYRDPFVQVAPLPDGNETSQGGATGKSYTKASTSHNIRHAKTSPVGNTSTIPRWQKDLAHWTNKHQIYEACDFKDFSPRKNFICNEYFNN